MLINRAETKQKYIPQQQQTNRQTDNQKQKTDKKLIVIFIPQNRHY